MRNKTKQIMFISVVSLAIAGLMLSCSSLNQLDVKPKAEAEKSTGFQLSGLSISPGEVAARDEVVISAEVTNITSADDIYNAELKINNVTEASDKVLVPAGKTQTLTFVIFKDALGTYKVSLGQLSGQFSVTESIAAVPGNQTPALSSKSGASCCGNGAQVSPIPAQSGSSCCGTGVQNSPAAPRRLTGGGGCRGR